MIALFSTLRVVAVCCSSQSSFGTEVYTRVYTGFGRTTWGPRGKQGFKLLDGDVAGREVTGPL